MTVQGVSGEVVRNELIKLPRGRSAVSSAGGGAKDPDALNEYVRKT